MSIDVRFRTPPCSYYRSSVFLVKRTNIIAIHVLFCTFKSASVEYNWSLGASLGRRISRRRAMDDPMKCAVTPSARCRHQCFRQ